LSFVSGGINPTNNSQVVIDNPESVNLVNPPTKIIRIISTISVSNQILIDYLNDYSDCTYIDKYNNC
jgi:ribosomal protein L32E